MVVQTAKEAVGNARTRYENRSTYGRGYCLKDTRGHIGIDSLYLDAQTAWEENNKRRKFTTEKDIPYGAPVWSARPVNPGYGHVFLAGGRTKKGTRIFWTNDQFGDGRITPVDLGWFNRNWGHEIQGWAAELNGVTIPYLVDRGGGTQSKPNPQPPTRVERLVNWREGLQKAHKRAVDKGENKKHQP